MDWFLELFASFSPNFYGYYLTIAREVTNILFIKTYPMKNPSFFPEKKFNRYIFFSYLFRRNFVLIKTSLGCYYFRWVKSLNESVKVHGEKFQLSTPPDWVEIVHLVDVKR